MSLDLAAIVAAARGEALQYLATVVETHGPCYRRTGARMLVGPDGRLAGSVSGGCLERDLVRRAAWIASEGPRIIAYDTAAEGDEEDRAYLGCGGVVHVLVEALSAAKLQALTQAARQRRPSALLTVVNSGDPEVRLGDTVAVAAPDATESAPVPLSPLPPPAWWGESARSLAGRSLVEAAHVRGVLAGSGGPVEVLAEHVPPRRDLLIAGLHHDVAPVIELARVAGWRVTLASGAGSPAAAGAGADARIDLESSALDAWLREHPYGALVIMTHSVALDRLCLAAAIRAGHRPYVGVLGPADRTQKLVEAVRAAERVSAAALAALRAPVGLPLGGEGPAAVALSVVAELEQTYARRVPTVREPSSG